MRREVIDAAITHQFKRYLRSKNKDFDKLTEDELKVESVNFLKEKYPGAKKPPHNLIELMASQEVQRTVKSTKLVFPNEMKSCKEHAKRRKKRNIGPQCKDGWYKNILGDCLKHFGVKTVDQTKEICKNEGATLADFRGDSAAVMYKDYMDNTIDGMPDFITGTVKQFWFDAEWKGDDSNGDYKYSDGTILQGNKYMPSPRDHANHDPSIRKCTVAVPHNDGSFRLKVSPYKCGGGGQTRRALCRIKNDSPPPIVIDDATRTICAGSNCKKDEDLPMFPCHASSKRKRSTGEDQENNNVEDIPENIQKLNLLLDPEKEEERKDRLNKTRIEYEDNFGGMNYSVVYENLLEILWYSQLPCFDVKNITSMAKDELSIIKKCSWKEKEMSCQAIFKTLPTDRGICCSFNMEKAEEIFQKSTYSALVQDMQTFDESNRYTIILNIHQGNGNHKTYKTTLQGN